jgi:hypothetical protein
MSPKFAVVHKRAHKISMLRRHGIVQKRGPARAREVKAQCQNPQCGSSFIVKREGQTICGSCERVKATFGN